MHLPRRPSAALILSTVSLVFSVTGTAAAAHYAITSSSQVKPGALELQNLSAKARAALQGQRGPAGPPGEPSPDAGYKRIVRDVTLPNPYSCTQDFCVVDTLNVPTQPIEMSLMCKYSDSPWLLAMPTFDCNRTELAWDSGQVELVIDNSSSAIGYGGSTDGEQFRYTVLYKP